MGLVFGTVRYMPIYPITVVSTMTTAFLLLHVILEDMAEKDAQQEVKI